MKHFKFLARGTISPITGHVWKPGVWVAGDGALAPCERGVHVLRPRDLAHWLHEEFWGVETDGESVEGSDCIVVRRARLVDCVAPWSDDGGERFAVACLDRLGAALAQASTAEPRAMLEHHHRAVSAHVRRKNRAMAAYVTAMGMSKIPGSEAIEERFRAERAWQSEWLVRELALGS
jgi:hypothetical protein